MAKKGTHAESIDPARLGIAGGIIWAAALFVCTLVSLYSGLWTVFLALVADIYPGYTVSLAGSIVGAVYGFVDMFVFLYVLAWLYNRVGRK
ncbi:MAG: bacteriophage holin [Candidatus Marsarchaeota archaeon]|nr:bacteriophage holin [Candidatus Marsarchaeota archaeon]